MNWLLFLADTANADLFDKPSAGTTIINVLMFAAVPVAVIVGFVFLIRSLRRKP